MSLATSREANLDKVLSFQDSKTSLSDESLGFCLIITRKSSFFTCKIYDPLIIKLSCVSLSLVVLSGFGLPTLVSGRLQKVSDWHGRAEMSGL